MKKKIYLQPIVEIVEIEVEKGFAASNPEPSFPINDWGNQNF